MSGILRNVGRPRDWPGFLENAEKMTKELIAVAPYISYAARFASFKGFVYDKKHLAKCSSQSLAEAGFYSTATEKCPSSAKCPFCLLELEFAENDDPWEIHQEEQPNCDFVMIEETDERGLSLREIATLAVRCATVAEYEKMLKIINFLENFNPRTDKASDRTLASQQLADFRNASKLLTIDQRLAALKSTDYGQKKRPLATLKGLARAGFVSTHGSMRGTIDVTCAFCHIQVYFADIDTADDFWQAHKRKSAECDFVKLNKLNEKDWSTEEGLRLAVRIVIMDKYEKQQDLLCAVAGDISAEMKKLAEKLKRMMAKPICTRRSLQL